MKKQSVNAIEIAKKLFLGSVMSAALVFSANAHNTIVSGPRTSVSADPASGKAEIKYAGISNNELSFNVKYNNPSGTSFTLLVLDENGESLYKAAYFDKKFDKTFKLPKEEVSKLTFLIQAGKETFKERFDVNINTREVEDVVVRKGN